MSLEIDLSNKRALIMGVANSRSLGWAIAQKLLEAGCHVGFSYQGERLEKELLKLTDGYQNTWIQQCDATSEEDLRALFERTEKEFGKLDILVHSIGFAPRSAMEGRFLDTTSEDWNTALNVSAYTLVSSVRHAENILNDGASIVSLTFNASQRVVPRYNVMGAAKAALETATRYLAYELGTREIRVNAISAGPMRTIAARSIPEFSDLYKNGARLALFGRNPTPEEIGNLGLYLLSDLGTGVTGQVINIDCGANIAGLPRDEIEK